VLTIQDDAIPVTGFSEVLPLIARDVPVCLWMSAIPSAAAGRARKAYGRSRYISLGPAPFVPLVAVLWPRNRLVEFGEWSTGQNRLTRADDGNVARWMRQTRQEFLVTVPSIVEHDDWTPTVKGGTRKESHGLAKDRVALLLADDARDYEW
jgi:hypothetical protein